MLRSLILVIVFSLPSAYGTIKAVVNGITPDEREAVGHREAAVRRIPEISWKGSAPAQPLITVSIVGHGWGIRTETGANSSLSILSNTNAQIICVAKHPVLWYKKEPDGEFEPCQDQTRVYSRYLEKPDNYSTDGAEYPDISSICKDCGFLIPAIYEYNAWMQVQNMSQEESGEYLCASPIGFFPITPTKIRLSTHDMPEPQDYAQVIQSGFDNILTPNRGPYYGALDEEIDISIIYTTPSNSTVNHTIYFPFTNITYLPDDPNATISEAFGIHPIISQVTRAISRSSLILSKAGGAYKAGTKFQFVFRSELSNGSIIDQRWEANLCKEAYSPFSFDSIDGAQTKVLVAGEPYEFSMYLLTRAKIEIAFLSAIELFFDGAKCQQRMVLANRAMEICGVEGFSRIDSESWGERWGEAIGISAFIRGKRPCSFAVTYFLSVDGIRTPVQSTPFVFAVLNLTSVRSNFNASSDARDLQLLVNETVTLECLVPACQIELVIGWCKLTNKVEHETLDTSDMDVCTWFPASIEAESVDPPWENNPETLVDPSISTAIKNVDQSTRSYQITFNPTALNHSGYFACVHHQRWVTGNTKKVSSEGVYEILIQEPIPPRFPDGQYFGTEDVVIKQGMSTSLNCPVEGLPTPDVEWTWNDQPFAADQFSLSTPLTLSVDREGRFTCIATNGHGENGRVFQVRFEKGPFEVALGVGIPFAVLFVIVSVVTGRWWKRRHAFKKALRHLASKLRSPPEFVAINPDLFLNDQTDILAYNREFEIDRSSFTLTKDTVLGSGAFGIVYKGRYENKDVAVKVVRDRADLVQYRALIDEATILSNIPIHINVLGLIAACTDNMARNEDLCILTEFCSNGSLLSYLQKNRSKFISDIATDAGQYLGQPGAVEILLNFAYQAALGMQHLAASKIVHRDLALRNLLLTEGNVVKIGDYGLAGRYLAKCSFDPNQPLPALWMAVESFEPQRQFSLMSDVWSFGVVLWEMFSCGEHPYSEKSTDFPFRIGYWLQASDDNRLGLPKIACDEMYQIMRSCWNSDPQSRPSFHECKRIIGQVLERKSASSYQAMVSTLNSAWMRLGGKGAQNEEAANSEISNEQSDSQPDVIAGSAVSRAWVEIVSEPSWSDLGSHGQDATDYTAAIKVHGSNDEDKKSVV